VKSVLVSVELREKSAKLHSNFAFFLDKAHSLGNASFREVGVVAEVLQRIFEVSRAVFQVAQSLEAGGHVVKDHKREKLVSFAFFQ
jgi:hypothetical protein